MKQIGYPGGIHKPLITTKDSLTLDLQVAGIIRAELTGRTCTRALCIHGLLKTRMIDAQITFTRNVRCQVHRETVGIVKLEDRFAGNHTALHTRKVFLQDFHALLQGLGKTFLFQFQNALDVCLVLYQLRVSLTHFCDQRGNQLVEKQLIDAQLISMTYCTTNDATQHITASFIGGQHAIHNQKRAGTNMVRNHPQ